MKKYIIFSLLCLISFASCTDFLDKNSLSNLNSKVYLKDEADAQKLLVGCYNALNQGGLYSAWPGYGSSHPRELEFATDNGYIVWYDWIGPDVLSNNMLRPSSTLVAYVWTASYTGIARCNDVIENVPLMTEEQIDPKVANQIVCEAKFLRALLYNYLTSLFRDVPFVTTVLTGNNQIPKTKKAVIIDAIVKDLQDISGPNMLPVTNQRGRATKGAALGLLSRVCLYNEMYEEAAQAAQDLIDLNEYIIDPSYADLCTETGNTSKEIVFAVCFDYKPGDSSVAGALSLNYGYPVEWILPYKNLVDDYYCTDGKPVTTSSVTTRDPRLGYTMITPGSMWNGEYADYAWWFYNAPLGYFMRKFQNKPDYENRGDKQSYYVIRYADVLLMRAEALAKLGRDKTEIMNMIDQVRQRADVMMPKVEDVEGTGLSFDQLLEVVKHERRVELAFEGFRYFDLLRWKEMEKAYNKCNTEINYDGTILGGKHVFDNNKGYVWPIPQDELDANKALIQHVEWGGKE